MRLVDQLTDDEVADAERADAALAALADLLGVDLAV